MSDKPILFIIFPWQFSIIFKYGNVDGDNSVALIIFLTNN